MGDVSRRELLGLAAILLLFLGTAAYQLDLPGLHYDEAFEAVPAVQLLHNQPVSAFRDSGLVLFGRRFPYTTQDYIGALNTYASLPFLAIFGPDPRSLRAYALLIGCLTLLLTWRFSRALTGDPRAGLAATALLAVNPTFVFWNRQGVFVTAVTATIGVGAAYCWLRWFQSGGTRPGYGLAGAFLFGLGIYAKLLFLWLVVAMAGAAALLTLDRWWPALRARRWPDELVPRPSVRFLLASLVAAVVACWPLIVYNLQTAGTFNTIQVNAIRSYYGVENQAVWPNLVERIKQFGVLLDSGHLWYLGQIRTNLTMPVVFLLTLGGVLGLSLYPVPGPGLRSSRLKAVPASRAGNDLATVPPGLGRRALFPFLLIGLVILQSIVTVSALWITHYALLMPWPAIALAAGGYYLSRQLPQAKLGAAAPVVALALVLVTEFWTTVSYHRSLAESGGLGAHSDAIYDLAAWLEDNTTGPVVAMDWGLAAPVIFLTQGVVTPVEAFGYAWETDEAFAVRLEGFTSAPASLYLWRAPDEIIFDRSADFKAIYRQHNLEETIVEAFYERSGRPVLGITRLVPQGSADNPP
ncbi:MAG: glycosyltransferase family 39 protein [Anaerolineae bacterium]